MCEVDEGHVGGGGVGGCMPSVGGDGTACAIGVGDAGDATSDDERMDGDGGGRGEVQLHVSFSTMMMMALGTKVNFGGPQNRRRGSHEQSGARAKSMAGAYDLAFNSRALRGRDTNSRPRSCWPVWRSFR